ncbi:MAG: hypothetical protein AUI36_36555 [Cyanobacteria bacterium 13_1_40CM_2_61_4]|nr:MAG: hypothetical protein AUI36_36555 [Cyanobacteria bacterium 13_1_40CM_2_61_4]
MPPCGLRIYEIDHLETLKDDDQLVRAFAARAIWRTEQSADIALPVFLEALKSDQRYRRGRAVGFIGELGSAAETAVPALVEALRDEDNSIRAEACPCARRNQIRIRRCFRRSEKGVER